MGAIERRIDRANQRCVACLRGLGQELHRARIEHGLSQTVLADAARTAQSNISRIERGLAPDVSIRDLVRLFDCVGLDLSVRAYPVASPLRDKGHRALLERLRGQCDPALRWRYEVPLPLPGDLRAWDVGVDQYRGLSDEFTAVEAETRPSDLQALQRREALKLRDDPRVRALVLLLSDTRYNRRLTQEYGEALRAGFPIQGQSILADLARGREPGGSGIVLL